MSFRSFRAGQTVLIRATVVDACSDCGSDKAVARVRIEDYPEATISMTTFVPFGEIVAPDGLERLLRPPTIDPTTARRSPVR